MRHFILILGLLLLAAPASGQWGSFGSKQKKLENAFARGIGAPLLIFDADCTDAQNTPATTDGTDVRDEDNWDSRADAVNVLGNLGDAVQTGGAAADGWCDATPWVINGTITTDTADSLWIGPFPIPTKGLYLHWLSTTAGSTVDLTWQFDDVWDTGQTAFAGIEGGADTSNTEGIYLFNPLAFTNASLILHSKSPMPVRQMYLVVDLGGAASWVMNLEAFHIR